MDPNAAARKRDHIELAFKSQIIGQDLDNRFYYEPLLAAHPTKGSWGAFPFLGKTFQYPLWVSSMTGGTGMARIINQNLARACKDFGMGMGLGSCRGLLYSDEYLGDFAVRPLIGDQPLYANLGIAQLETLIKNNELARIDPLIEKLEADGLIIHVNPLQEWLQPEGDRFEFSPLQTIELILDKKPNLKLIVKEVGQGFGYESLKTLLQMPLEAIDFAAAGGTNFAKLELLRSDAIKQELYDSLAHVGHTANEMVDFTNLLLAELGEKVQCKQIIVSGGVKNFLDGYYLISKLNTPSVYGQASAFLQHAQGNYEALHTYIESQAQGLDIAKALLKSK
jgi:isopentenyl-diphosphate Delta-isomerase